MKKLILLTSLILLSACGTQGTINAELATQKIPVKHSRIIVTRDNSLLYMAGAANVSVDGQQIASLARGASVLKDFPAGLRTLSVNAPTTFGTYSAAFDLTAGKTYEFVVSPNDQKSMAMGMAFGAIGDSIDNKGYFKIKATGFKPK